MNLLTYLLAIVIATAVVGYLGKRCAQRGVGELYWATHRVFAATFLMFLLIAVNYVMAATALNRILGNEQYQVDARRDPFGWVFLGNHSLYVAPLLAIVMVVFSIVASGVLVRSVKVLLRLVAPGERPALREWLPAALWVAPMGAVVAFDASLMALRLAMMLFPGKMEGGLAELPAVWQLGDLGTAAGSLLFFAVLAYPAIILAAERNFSHAWERFNRLSLDATVPERTIAPPVPVGHTAPRPAPPRPRVQANDPFQDMIRPIPPAHQ